MFITNFDLQGKDCKNFITLICNNLIMKMWGFKEGRWVLLATTKIKAINVTYIFMEVIPISF